ncbi:MAG: hypothetical protein WAM09_03915 [Anaerolineales bacterium]
MKSNNTPSKNSLQAPERPEEQLLQGGGYNRYIRGIPKAIRENPARLQPMETQGCQPLFWRLQADMGGILITDPIGLFFLRIGLLRLGITRISKPPTFSTRLFSAMACSG